MQVAVDDALLGEALALSEIKVADEVIAAALRSYVHVRKLQMEWDVQLNGSAEQKAAIAAEYAKRKQADDDEVEKQALGYDYDARLAVTAWVFKHLVAHMKSGSGTFRFLINDRLGFGSDAYRTLYDGLDLSNAFAELMSLAEAKATAGRLKIAEMKPVLNLCDEQDCFEEATCGWPSPTGFRKTCRVHQQRP